MQIEQKISQNKVTKPQNFNRKIYGHIFIFFILKEETCQVNNTKIKKEKIGKK